MSDEKNVNSADSAEQSEKPMPAPKPAAGAGPAAGADSTSGQTPTRAEVKAAKSKAKVEAKLEKLRAKEEQQRAKLEKNSTSAPAEPEKRGDGKPLAKAEAAGGIEATPTPVVPAANVGEKLQNEVQGETSSGSEQPSATPDRKVAEPEEAKTNATSASADRTRAANNEHSAKIASAEAESVKPKSEESAQPADAQALRRRRKLDKVRARAAAKNEAASAAEAAGVAAVPDPAPVDSKVSSRRRKLDKARVAASKDAASAPARKKTGAVLLSLAAVVAAAGAVGAGSVFAPAPANKALSAAVTNLPAGDLSSICAGTPQLLKGVDGTDAQFAPGAKEISSNLRSVVVSDLAKRVPGAALSKLDGSNVRQLTERIPDEEASQARGADSDGMTGRIAKVSTINNLDDPQTFSLQPLGELASTGSTLRSYQAKDGDLAGLATATCQVPSSSWRFTGLQTSTGSTSVLQLSNPTHTTAQVSLRLRGPAGIIDTSTLQNIVLAPGAHQAIVLGAYAQNLESVSAEITSEGGKIAASVQQAALRGLTPSGIELVSANASAGNTQVIPGVWIDSKENISQLSASDASLVPQLHVSATGASGAGFTVKVLGQNGEVAGNFEGNLAVDSDATKVLDLKQLAGGYYTLVVEADAPVTAAVKMVRGAKPEDSSDTAWAVSSSALAGTQAMPLSANGTGQFALAAIDADSTVEAVVVNNDGTMEKSRQVQIKAGQSIVFDPKSVSADAQAVIFSTDANAYIAQLVLGSDRSIAWAAMPQTSIGRDGIVVNVGG